MRVQLWQTPQKEASDVLSRSAGAGEDEGVGKTAGGDGGAEVFDGGAVA